MAADSPKAPARPKPPAALKVAGKALFNDIINDLSDDWELDSREIYLLTRACRCADEMATLEKVIDKDGPTVEGSRGQVTMHPAIAEARQLRLVQLRLLAALELSDPSLAVKAATPSQARARKASNARWARDRRPVD